ncbi:MAG: endonuclease domain-containing protein [Pseudomonadota bacterium]
MANEFARRLRRNQTKAERMLWQALRGKQLGGYRFRRQHPMGPYVADFICLERKLIVELDGDQHAFDATRDKKRDDWLQSRGYFVLRFWNNEVYDNLPGVLEKLLEHLQIPQASPPP